MKRFLVFTFFSLVAIPILFTNCSSDSDSDGGIAPDIPPLTTFLMDFSISEADEGRVETKSNWGFSALNVTLWNTAITFSLAIPIAAFGQAIEQEPSFNESLPGWVWEYEYAAFNTTYQARLEAQISGDEINWEMFISNNNAFTDFNWYSGTSALDGLSGQWILNKTPEEPTPFLQVDWNRSLDGEQTDIQYLNIVPDSDDRGSFIRFEIDTSNEFDRTYDIFSALQDSSIEIEWDSVNKDGRVKAPNHFEDSEYHCWDEILDDIDCPS